MQPEMETNATQTERGWQDKDGFIGPYQPGNGPRSDPKGVFPTGPEIGEAFPSIQCRDVEGRDVSLSFAQGNPTIFIFFRSAVW